MPYKYNSFINNSDISWACEMYNIHSFNRPFSIHKYLINSQKSGKIKSYHTVISKWIKGKIEDYYFEIDKKYHLISQEETYKDTTDEVKFHEIFYLEDHKLKSHIITAAPLLKVFTSTGIYLGNAITSFSSLNYYSKQKYNEKDSIIYLGNTYSILNFDSLESGLGLKKNYGMTLPLALWYDLSKGFNSVIDLKSNSTISPQNIMDFSAFDSTEHTRVIDSMPDFLSYKVPGPPAFSYFSDIGISQEWYYNKTKDVFFANISKVYLYIEYYDEKSFLYLNEKRFEINFK